MAMRIAKTFRFEAAHRLEGWDPSHKCHNLHGHSYKVQLVLEGPVPKFGDECVLDFGEIRHWWSMIEPSVDHQYLNEALNIKNTTAEVLCVWFAEAFKKWRLTKSGVHLARVRVYETEDSYAEYDL